MFNYRKLGELINNRTAKIAIWGCGFVGTTNIFYLVKEGFQCVGIDINTKRVKEIKDGIYNINSDERTIGEIDQKEKERFIVTDDYMIEPVYECSIHMLCLPTEKNFQPTRDYVEDVVGKIASMKLRNILVIIESSMPPRYIDESIINIFTQKGMKEYEDYVIGAAPRRDLFGDKYFSLRETDRVIGADCIETTKIMESFYNTFCSKLVIAKDCYHAVLSKIVENTFRCLDISLCNQLALGLKEFDVVHVLELAATKWNMERYHPSFGIGGYCIPLAPQYIKEQMEFSNTKINIINEILSFNSNSVENFIYPYKKIIDKKSNILVMGISSIPNVGILNCSIGLKVYYSLKKEFENVYVNDPFLSDSDMTAFDENIIVKDLANINFYDVVFVITSHDIYKKIFTETRLKDNMIIIDTFGLLKENLSAKYANYYEVGSKWPTYFC